MTYTYSPTTSLPAICSHHDEPFDLEGYLDASYEAGYDAGLKDYDDRPGAEHPHWTGHRVRWCVAERRLVYAMTPLRFEVFSWRPAHGSVEAYSNWFECEYGFDLETYLKGFDDAGAGLPSAVCDPDRHAAFAAALDVYEPEPVLYDFAIGPMPAPTDEDFDLPF